MHLLTTTGPVFLLVLTGFVAVRRGLFDDSTVDALMRYAVKLAIPCLLFRAVSTIDLHAAYGWRPMLGFYGAALACFATATLLARRAFGRRPGEAVAVGFAGLFSNTVMMGLPVVTLTLGQAALPTAYAIVSLHAPFCYLVGIVAMEASRADGRTIGHTATVIARAMFGNSLMIGIGLGFAVNVAGVPVPEPVSLAVGMLADSALPVALVGLGGVLTRYALSERWAETVMVALVSLVLHPALALALCSLTGLAGIERSVVVLMAAMSPGANAYLFANMYGRGEGTAAAAVLLGTVAASVSVALWVGVLAGP